MSSVITNRIAQYHEMFFDDFGIVFNVSYDDQETGIDYLLDDHIETLLTNCKANSDSATLYDIGHELRRYAEKLIDAADIISTDKNAIADMLDE